MLHTPFKRLYNSQLFRPISITWGYLNQGYAAIYRYFKTDRQICVQDDHDRRFQYGLIVLLLFGAVMGVQRVLFSLFATMGVAYRDDIERDYDTYGVFDPESAE